MSTHNMARKCLLFLLCYMMYYFQNRHIYPLKIMYSFQAHIELPHTPLPPPPAPNNILVPKPSDLSPRKDL